jgi:hypothetical protein
MSRKSTLAKETPVSPSPLVLVRDPILPPDKYPRLRNDFKSIEVQPDTGCWLWIGKPIDPADALSPAAYVYGLLNDPLTRGQELESLCGTEGCVCPFHMRIKAARKWGYVPLPREDPVILLRRALAPKKAPVVAETPEMPVQAPVVHVPVVAPVVKVEVPTVKAKAPVAPLVKKDPEGAVKLCIHGHEQILENLYVYPNGKRACRTCKRERDRRSRVNKEPVVVVAPEPVVVIASAPPEPVVAPASSEATDRIVGLCLRGHLQVPENLYVYPGGKRSECKVCKRERDQKRRVDQKAKRG